MTIRVLVADDQAMVRAGFRMLLSGEEDIEVVAEASNGLEAVHKAARFHPTVVLMDIRMPQLDGLEASRRILATDNTARILILTTFDLDEYVYEALRAGASGFLLKDRPPEELVSAVRTVAARDALLAPSITRRLVAAGTAARILILTTFDLDEYVYDAIRAGASGFLLKDARPAQLVDAIEVVARGEALLAPAVTRRLLDRFAETLPGGAREPPPALSSLTERELEVLRLLAAGLSNAELAERLFLSETTVKSHVSSVLRKLDVRDRVQAVVLAYEAGLVRVGER